MKLRDASPSKRTNIANMLEEARADRRYIMQRRDQYTEKIRFGLVTLNGGSLVAVLALLGTKPEIAETLGFSPGNAVFTLAALVCGLIMASVSIRLEQDVLVGEAADGNSRLLKLGLIIAEYEEEISDQRLADIRALQDELIGIPITGFRYSLPAIWLQNLSAGAWLAGLLVPLFTLAESLWSA